MPPKYDSQLKQSNYFIPTMEGGVCEVYEAHSDCIVPYC